MVADNSDSFIMNQSDEEGLVTSLGGSAIANTGSGSVTASVEESNTHRDRPTCWHEDQVGQPPRHTMLPNVLK